MKTASSAWGPAEWAAAKHMAEGAHPPERDEVAWQQILDELRAEAKERRAERRKAMRGADRG